jgi:hypothetical protein
MLTAARKRIMSISKMSTYEHMINALLYPVGTRGYGTDTRVPVLLEYSTLVCLNDKGIRKVVTAVEMYSCTYTCTCTPGTPGTRRCHDM